MDLRSLRQRSEQFIQNIRWRSRSSGRTPGGEIINLGRAAAVVVTVKVSYDLPAIRKRLIAYRDDRQLIVSDETNSFTHIKTEAQEILVNRERDGLTTLDF